MVSAEVNVSTKKNVNDSPIEVDGYGVSNVAVTIFVIERSIIPVGFTLHWSTG